MPAHFQVYEPTPLIIPRNLGICRDIPRELDAVQDLSGYDRYTLFYDVFYDRDAQSLIAIAPRFLNLWRLARRSRFYLDGVRLQPTVLVGSRGVNCNVWQLECASPLPPKARLTVRIPGHEWQIDVQDDRWRTGEHELSVATIQKNNPLPWIQDWILYHHKVHGVSQFVIYDNGSDDFKSLVSHLRTLSNTLSVSVVLVRWNFPYGVAHRLNDRVVVYGRGAQNGALTHSNYRVESGYLLNIDIDEYVGGSTHRLYEYLQREQPTIVTMRRKATPILKGGQGDSKNSSYRNSTLVRRKFEKEGKYAVKLGVASKLGVHYAYGSILADKSQGISSRLWRLARRKMGVVDNYHIEEAHHAMEFVVYNYEVHNTGWKEAQVIKNSASSTADKSTWQTKRLERYDPQRHVLDDSVQQLARKYGLL